MFGWTRLARDPRRSVQFRATLLFEILSAFPAPRSFC